MSYAGLRANDDRVSFNCAPRHFRKGGSVPILAVMLMGTASAYSILSNAYRFDAAGK
jgi:hypothetical protein